MKDMLIIGNEQRGRKTRSLENTSAQRVKSLLAANDGSTIKDLEQLSGYSNTTVNRYIVMMIEEGWILRQKQLGDVRLIRYWVKEEYK